ncbi:hypothetical protein [Burkholderia multivorans]|uniref:hypothetical protein n=1 Tax=Burkholderia multivorans TaxID=87883 RepID=UPI0011782B88|nr:hypothetical protein [Burkholderia multivorans]
MSVINASQSDTVEFSVSVVVYRPDEAQLRDTLDSLRDAAAAMRLRRPEVSARLYLIDNGGFGGDSASRAALEASGIPCTMIAGHGNVGYGCGHNLAVERVTSTYEPIRTFVCEA